MSRMSRGRSVHRRLFSHKMKNTIEGFPLLESLTSPLANTVFCFQFVFFPSTTATNALLYATPVPKIIQWRSQPCSASYVIAALVGAIYMTSEVNTPEH